MRSKIIVIGCGFAGLAAVQALYKIKDDLEVIVIDKGEYFNFLPLLPDVIGRGINPNHIIFPINTISRSYNSSYLNEEVVSVDLESSVVVTDKSKIDYDYLIIASGSETNFYGNQAIKNNAYKLDNARDAQKIIKDMEARDCSSFIVSGGGYTGIEIASNLWRYYNNRGKAKDIVVVERSEFLLGPLPEWVKRYIGLYLEKLGISVFLDCTVNKVNNNTAELSNGKIFNNSMLIWSAGVKSPDFVQNLNKPKTAQGRVIVDRSLRITENCFVVGDAASFSISGEPIRMSVQFSITQGICAAQNIINIVKNREVKGYMPVDLGYVIPMADNSSCGQVFGIKVRGRLGIFLHYLMCSYRSYSLRNKLGILKDLF